MNAYQDRLTPFRYSKQRNKQWQDDKKQQKTETEPQNTALRMPTTDRCHTTTINTLRYLEYYVLTLHSSPPYFFCFFHLIHFLLFFPFD